MKRKPARGDRVSSFHRVEDWPRDRAAVVAVVGRSNVGKSSLLNRLLGRDAARVGKTPGKTRGIHFYETEEGYRLADLPGTGFARVSRDERERWAELADRLLRSGRVRLAVTLLDARVPDAEADRAMRDYLAALGVPSLVVATKWDRLSAREKAPARRRLEAEHGAVLAVSAVSGEGIEELRREIRRRVKEVEE